ncbi:MAG: hypothetical protein WD875_15615 [Pirellulales bacterium]
MRSGKEETADNSAEKNAAHSDTKDNEASKKTDHPQPAAKDGKATPPQANSDSDPNGDGKKPTVAANEKPAEAPIEKPSVQPVTPATPPAAAVKEFRGIEEVPIGERPAALETMIADSVVLLEADKFDEFFATHVDPRDRGPTPPAAGRRRRNDSPYDVLNQGTERIATILSGIGQRKPHLFEDGKIAVFDLSSRTRPTFVEIEGKWYLSRGVATSMDRRFANLTPAQEIVYLLEVTSGEPAVGPADAQREGTEQGIIEQLVQMGAYVALSHPDQEYRRSAVMITEKFKGGDAGLALLGQLSDRSQMVVLVVDGITGANITENVGFFEFASLEYLEYLRFVNPPPLTIPLTVHFQEMGKLKTLIFDGGDLVGDTQISDHLFRAAELKRLSIKGTRISDSTLERLKKFTVLESLELDVPAGAVTPAAIADLRKSKSGLWVEH